MLIILVIIEQHCTLNLEVLRLCLSVSSAQQTKLRCDNVVTTLCFGCHNVVN